MQTFYMQLWSHVAALCSQWDMFRHRVYTKSKHILCSIMFSQNLCRLWNNVAKHDGAGQATDGNIIRRMRIACWITKATNTPSKYVILFPLSQWLRERTSELRCMYIAYVVTVPFTNVSSLKSVICGAHAVSCTAPVLCCPDRQYLLVALLSWRCAIHNTPLSYQDACWKVRGSNLERASNTSLNHSDELCGPSVLLPKCTVVLSWW